LKISNSTVIVLVFGILGFVNVVLELVYYISIFKACDDNDNNMVPPLFFSPII